MIDVNKDTNIPTINVKANPLTEPLPNQNKIPAVIKELTLESRIEF